MKQIKPVKLPEIDRKKWIPVLKKALFPNRLIIFLLFPVSVVLLVYSLGYEQANPVIQYISYSLSAYTLVLVCVRIPEIAGHIRRLLHRNKLASRYLEDKQVRDLAALHTGTGVDSVFAVLKLAMGIWLRSGWLIAVAIYHMTLSVMHALLLAEERASQKRENEYEKRLYRLKSYRLCGRLMVWLNLAMSGMLVQMIWKGQGFSYPGFLVYAFAAYAFYCLIFAIVKVVKYWKIENPVFSASRNIGMAKALMSLFTLQTVLLRQFGTEDVAGFELLMNTLTGGGVCFVVLAMAVLMIRKANRELDKMKRGVL